MTRLELDLRHRYGDFELDAQVDIQFERLGILGPSGSGKTTLVDALAGHRQLSYGRIKLEDRTLLDTDQSIHVSRHRREIGYMMQEAPLFPHMTLRQNLVYPPAASDSNPDFETYLDLFDLRSNLDQYPGELSGGQRRRGALMQVLMREPDLLILDEPTVGLNSALQRELVPELNDALRSGGIPSLIISHDPGIVAALCESILVVHDGRITDRGSVKEILRDSPARSRGGVDDRNLYRARVTAGEDRLYRAETDTGLSIQFTVPRSLRVGQRVVLSFGAAEPVIGRDVSGQLSPRNQWQGTIHSVHEEPERVLLVVDVGGTLVRARVTRETVRELGIKEGETLTVYLKSTATELLPASR